MGRHALVPVLITLGVYLIMQGNNWQSVCAAESAIGIHRRTIPVLVNPRTQGASIFRGARIEPPFSEVLIDDGDEVLDGNKRQFDDYGHMRFGKRGGTEDKFDDYGHMRFGRSHT